MRPPAPNAPFDLPSSDDPRIQRTPEERADLMELRSVLLRQLEDRQNPAAIPTPLLLDGPPSPVPAPAAPKRPTAKRPKSRPGPVPPPPRPIFDRLSLYRPAEGDRAPAPYEMPGGGAVYPHPLSGGERKYVNVQVALHLQRLYGEREEPRTDEERTQRQMEVALDSEILADIWHTVVSARVGPEPGAARAFQDEDAEAFYRNGGWEEAAQEIAGRSRAYARGKSPEGMLREALAPFFAATQDTLVSCASQLDTVSSDGMEAPSPVEEVRKTLRNCATSLLPLTQPGTWGASEVEAATGKVR